METKQKILIVDDSAMNREILSEVLGSDYDYLFAGNGLQALEQLSQNPDVDLMLLDIRMPQLDGFGVLNILKQQYGSDEIPVIVLSAEEDVRIIQKAYDLGAVDYINRPFNLAIVQRRVRNTLFLYARQKQLVHLVEEQVYEREKNNSAMVNVLSHVIEARNHETGTHILHMRVLTDMLLHRLIRLTDRYPLSESDISMITNLSALHDVGKICSPEEILTQPGPLDDREMKIMKSHAALGDALLQNMPGSDGDPFVRMARDVCRHHHERWDGSGYPDGLKGDEISIAAQVVALADVFDALTSDRCYRKAIPFDKAMEMIHDGRCGAFNPLLMQCLDASRDELYAFLTTSSKAFDVQSEARHLAAEVLQNRSLPPGDHDLRILALEKAKSAFFAQECGGIQFEYDRALNRVVCTDWYAEPRDRVRALYLSEGDDVDLLSQTDKSRLLELVRGATPDSPDVEMRALISVHGQKRWHRLRARTLWERESRQCDSVIGQFTDVHDEVVAQGLLHLSESDVEPAALLRGLEKVFEIVRLVDPKTCRVLSLTADGKLMDTGRLCYETWNSGQPCANCSSSRAVEDQNWTSKLESNGSALYFVLSRALTIENRLLVLEIASRIDDASISSAQNQPPEHAGMLMLNFDRDALTPSYARLYLNHFASRYENADGVAMLDVDRFKQINDVFGHAVGDEALRKVAGAVLSCVRSTDTLIRYGGDEFLLIFSSIESGAFARRLTQIQDVVRRTPLPGHPEVRLSISIGGAYRVRPLKEAIRQADLRMYENKSRQDAQGEQS